MSKNEVVMNPRKVAVVWLWICWISISICTDAKWPVFRDDTH